MFRKSSLLATLALAFACLFGPARAAAQASGDVVVVLPFENTTGKSEYSWIGTSFADALTELLQVPGLGVVSTDERELIYQRLRLPMTAQPSRATAIKIAREAKATLVVLGSYEVKGGRGEDSPAEVRGTARVVRVNEGRLWRPYDFGGALINLQRMQGTLAYQILYQRDEALPVPLNHILEKATKVPPRAFESLVKGMMTESQETRSNYLQNALKEYARANAGAVYPQAAFELGHLYYRQGNWAKAAEYFSKLQKKDPHYAEAAFYAGLSYWRQNDLTGALGALVPLTNDMPLTGVFNNAGALSAQAARAEKSVPERERLLKQALSFLERAKESDPEDANVLYNYAYALFLSGRYADAAEQLRGAIQLAPRDGEALYLYAKALEKGGLGEQAAAADNEARRYLKAYAQLQTEWQKGQTLPPVSPHLNQQFDVAGAVRRQDAPVEQAGPSARDLLEKARGLYTAGRDDEVLQELNRILMIEPMNAEAHLLLGRVYQRRGDLVRAVASLKTSLFWDSKLIDAHILLGRIFLERGDRAQATVHARAAMQLDANNQEAVALQRQVELGAR